jgi:RNA polymerase sigma-70 factor (family 1)
MKNPGMNIIVGFNAGDPIAFRAIYDKYHRALYHFTRKLTSNDEESKDIVAEAFGKLWSRRSNFETEENIKAFLYISARNASLNYLRYQRKHSAEQKELFKELSHLNDDITELVLPSEISTITQLYELIQHSLENLPSKQKEVMEMILFEGLDDEEVAIRLNKSTKTIRNLKCIAVNFLRSNIDQRKLSPAVLVIFYSLI